MGFAVRWSEQELAAFERRQRGIAVANATGAIEVTVPIKVVSSANVREHWAARAKRTKLHRASVRDALLAEALLKGTTGPLTITLTRIAPRLLDDDNAIAGLKAARDGVADWLGRDDGDPLLTWRYGQEKGAYAVRVGVTKEGQS